MEVIRFNATPAAPAFTPRLRKPVRMSSVKALSGIAGVSSLKVVPQPHAVKKFSFLLAVIPLTILFTFLLVRINNFVVERNAVKVDFGVPFEATASYLDKVLFDFALSQDPFYDNEGNIVTSEGPAQSAVSVFRDPVSFQEYTVKSGESISSISMKFGLSNISTLIAVNGINNVRYLRSGQKLRIPSVDGLVHTVGDGETIEGISVKYHSAVEDILDVNDLDSYELITGQELFIPGARLDGDSLQRAMGELFTWPITAKWRLSSAFGARKDPFTGASSYHTGIDMACPTGTAITAAMSGTVAVAGWSSVFGNYVILKHIDGYQTLYGHMSKTLVKKGQFVSQGARIGLVGSTGYSTGPHLHFTVYKNGKLVNPLSVLK